MPRRSLSRGRSATREPKAEPVDAEMPPGARGGPRGRDPGPRGRGSAELGQRAGARQARGRGWPGQARFAPLGRDRGRHR
eukprot:14235207-Alexandrium_andersonii.AAC.1